MEAYLLKSKLLKIEVRKKKSSLTTGEKHIYKGVEQHQRQKEQCPVTWLKPHPSMQFILRNRKFLLQKREIFESAMLQYQDDLKEYHVAIECSEPFEHVVLWK